MEVRSLEPLQLHTILTFLTVNQQTINDYSFLAYSHIGLIGQKRASTTRREGTQERLIYKVKNMADKNIRHRYLYNDAYLAFTGWITDQMRIETAMNNCGVEICLQ